MDELLERNPKTLIYDIEVSPTVGYTYGRWQTNVLEVIKEPILMSIAWKWLGEKKTHSLCIADTPTYHTDPDYDYFVVKKLWELLDEADIAIGHNNKRFDNKMANTFFLQYDLGPASPYKSIDTYQSAKKQFKLGSAGLDNMCRMLGIGSKTKEKHSDLWWTCLNGNPKEKKKAWAKMCKYNERDVEIDEKLYLKIRPFMTTEHPNIARISNDSTCCPICGCSGCLQKRGFAYTNTYVYQRYFCKKCRHWSKGRSSIKEGDVKPDFVSYNG